MLIEATETPTIPDVARLHAAIVEFTDAQRVRRVFWPLLTAECADANRLLGKGHAAAVVRAWERRGAAISARFLAARASLTEAVLVALGREWPEPTDSDWPPAALCVGNTLYLVSNDGMNDGTQLTIVDQVNSTPRF